MRIAFDHQIFCWQAYGGISRYIVRLAQGLLDGGQEVAAFAPLHRNNCIEDLPPSVVCGRRLKAFPPKTTRLFLIYNQLIANRRICAWKPDVVHQTYYAVHSRKSRNYPTVVTVHDMIHELFSEEFSLRDATSQWKRDAVLRADHVICVSESTRRDLIRVFGTPEDKLSVVHHGVENFSSNYEIEGRKILARRPFILYVGNRGGYKNFTALLKAVSILPSLRANFDIVAFGGGAFTRQENLFIRELGFGEEQIRQLNGQDEVLWQLYRDAHSLVYPSRYEGFGLPPLEAMAHRCPVVCSNTSSMPEVIGDAAEYFDPYSVESMAYAIERVVHADDHARLLVQKGLERVKRFTWKRCAEETLAIYQKLTA